MEHNGVRSCNMSFHLSLMLSTINAFPMSHSQDDDISTMKIENNSEVSNSEAICAKLRICKIDQPVSQRAKRGQVLQYQFSFI